MTKKLNLNPQDCIVFEDSLAGVQSAYHAGMTVYAFPNEYTRYQDFSEFNQDSRVHVLKIGYYLLDDLLSLLKKK